MLYYCVVIVGGKDMSFDISKLTSAVNKYLNSISEISNAAKQSSEEMADRGQFSVDLKDAIAQTMQSKLRDQGTIPNVAQEVQGAISQATEEMNSVIKQINGSFEAMRDVERVSEVKSAGDSTSGKEAEQNNSNFDAYSGLLSTEALQELSKSQYFSANLLQNSLLYNSEEDEEDENNSLSGLNSKSLLTNSISSSSTLKEALESTSAQDSGDLARALIKAYANSGSSLADTSVFGDFSL